MFIPKNDIIIRNTKRLTRNRLLLNIVVVEPEELFVAFVPDVDDSYGVESLLSVDELENNFFVDANIRALFII
jgi:hypothetical protein